MSRADRPSVTDNARAETGWIEWAQNLTGAYVTTTEEARQQIEGLVSGLTELAGLTSRAAARAETTTEAIERIARETAMTGRDALELVEAVQALQDAETTTDDATQRLARAAFAVDSTHHFHVNSAGRPICTCGFVGDARARTQTEHITAAVLEEYDHD